MSIVFLKIKLSTMNLDTAGNRSQLNLGTAGNRSKLTLDTACNHPKLNLDTAGNQHNKNQHLLFHAQPRAQLEFVSMENTTINHESSAPQRKDLMFEQSMYWHH